MSKGIPVVSYSGTSSLSVKDIALTFRQGIKDRPRGLVGLLGSRKLDWEFFTPEPSTDPFDALEQREDSTFSAGAKYEFHQGMLTQGTTFGQMLDATTAGSVQIEIWDNGDSRYIEIRHAGAITPPSQKHVEAILNNLCAADPELKFSEQTMRID